MESQVWLLAAIVTLLTDMLLGKAAAIHCFQCYSLAGNQRDCEDHFGPYNQTGYLLDRDCVVGPGEYKAFHCVKIKGVKENGKSVVIRTCSVADWGTQCGDIHLEQPDKTEPITGCLASCDFDGCNGASGVHHVITYSALLSGLVCYVTWMLRVLFPS